MQSNDYWSGTEYARDPGGAWSLYTVDGDQRFEGKNNALYAVAVRPGG